MSGEDAKIDEMIIAAHKGPLLSRVDKVEFVGGRVSGFLPPIEEGIFRRI